MSDPTLVPSTIYPTLTYDDATSAIEWLCRVFGFTERLVISASIPEEGVAFRLGKLESPGGNLGGVP